MELSLTREIDYISTKFKLKDLRTRIRTDGCGPPRGLTAASQTVTPIPYSGYISGTNVT